MLSSITSIFKGDPESKTLAAKLRKLCEKGTVDEVSHQLDLGEVDLYPQDGSISPASLFNSSMEGNNMPVLKYLITRFQDGQPKLPWELALDISAKAVRNLEHFKLLSELNPEVMNAYYGHMGNASGWAVAGNHIEVVAFMLKNGLNPDQPLCGNRPAIHRAASDGNAEMITLLIDHGADLKKTNVLAEAQEEGKVNILKLLVEKGGMDINTPQIVPFDPDADSEVAEASDDDAAADAEAAAVDDEAADGKGADGKGADCEAAAGLAADLGWNEEGKYNYHYNDDGYDYDYMRRYGASEKSPVLHLAIAQKQAEVVRAILLDLEADATAKDGKGRTA